MSIERSDFCDCTLVAQRAKPWPHDEGVQYEVTPDLGLREFVVKRVHIVNPTFDSDVLRIQAGPHALFEGPAPALAFSIPRGVRHVRLVAGHRFYAVVRGACTCVVFEGELVDG